MTLIDVVSRSFALLVSNPLTLLSIVLSFALIVTHQSDPTQSAVKKIAAALSSNENVRQWLVASEERVLGFLCFLPVLLGFRRTSDRIYYGLAILIWVAFVPEHSIFEYVLQSCILRILVSLPPSYSNEKFIIILLVGFLSFTGYIFNFV